MSRGIIGMKNTLYNGYQGPRLTPDLLQKRLSRVIAEELTPQQRETLLAYYIQQKKIPTIAAERGVAKSTVSRTLHRAEGKLRRFLRY